MAMFDAPVGVCRLERYLPDETERAVARLGEMVRLKELVRPGMRVVIKPNLLMKRRPEETTTTHPEVVRGVIRLLRSLGVQAENITLADSPGGLYTHAALSGIYTVTGMRAVAEEEGIHLNDDYTSVETACPSPVRCHTFPIIRPVAEADLVISVCKLKTHCMTGLSGGVKNLFGTIPGLTKPDYHWRYPKKEDFCQMLVDLCETVRPAVTFCDAVESMEGDGPSSGSCRKTGMLLASRSPYQLDRALCRVIGREQQEILTLKAAEARGLCAGGDGELPLVGDELAVFADFARPRTMSTDFLSKLPHPLQKIGRPLVNRFLTSRPQIDTARCVGCGKCAESCPAHTIHIEKGKARIDHSKCIRCYCCHEMCPIHAIGIRQNRLLRL